MPYTPERALGWAGRLGTVREHYLFDEQALAVGYGLIQILLSESCHCYSIYYQWLSFRVDPAHCLHELTVAEHDHPLALGVGLKNAQRSLSTSN